MPARISEVVGLVILRTTMLVVVLAVSCIPCADCARELIGAPPGLGPLGMSGKSVGGAYAVGSTKLMDFVSHRDPLTQEVTYNWEPVGGARNIGLTAKIWGKVNAVYQLPDGGGQWFYADDGSGVDADFGDVGVLVYSDAPVKVGQFVSVVGTIGMEQSFDSWGRLVRTVEPVSADDVVVLRDVAPPPEYPFSDEFESDELDWRWVFDMYHGQYSMSTVPGSLTLTPKDPLSGSVAPFGVYQRMPPLWTTVEFCVKLDGVITTSPSGTVVAGLAKTANNPYTNWIAAVALTYAGGVPSSKVINISGQSVGSLGPDNTCWFRLRLDHSVIFVSYSLDGGVTYSPEHAASEWNSSYLRLYAYRSTRDISLTASFDYFRVSVPEQ